MVEDENVSYPAEAIDVLRGLERRRDGKSAPSFRQTGQTRFAAWFAHNKQVVRDSGGHHLYGSLCRRREHDQLR